MYWFLAGKIRAFAPVDHSDPASCDMVMAAFHGLYVGVDLTDSANNQFDAGQPWTVSAGERPDPSDGHCIVKVKADGQQYDTWVTWGALQQSTREWTAACIQEAWAVITSEDEESKLNMPSLLADIVAAGKAAAPGVPEPSSDHNFGATAFGLGWQMAQLYGPLQQPRAESPLDHLPSIAEYDTRARMDLGLDEVRSLLRRACLDDVERHGAVDACRTEDPVGRRYALRRLHFRALDTLECEDPSQAASYELGRALSDLCWMPDSDHQLKEGTRRVDVLFDQFRRDRLAILQGWLEQMSTLAPQTAPIVSRSVQNWSDWLDANAKKLKSDWAAHESTVVAALRNQSTAWYQLLSSERTEPVHPPMGAWIHAGEAIVRSTRALFVRVVSWFWPVIVVILAATGGLLYLALNDAEGTARVWTSILTIAAGLGAAGFSIRSGATRLSGGLEQTVWQAAELEARAWAVTWLPTIHQGWLSRYRLRQAGVDPPSTRRVSSRPEPPDRKTGSADPAQVPPVAAALLDVVPGPDAAHAFPRRAGPDPGRHPDGESAGRHVGVVQDHRVAGHDCAFSDHGVVQDHGRSADERPVVDGATLQVGQVADQDFVADGGRSFDRDVEYRAVLHVASGTDHDRSGVGPDHGTRPDRAVRADAHVADQDCVGVHIGGGVDERLEVGEGVDRHDGTLRR